MKTSDPIDGGHRKVRQSTNAPSLGPSMQVGASLLGHLFIKRVNVKFTARPKLTLIDIFCDF